MLEQNPALVISWVALVQVRRMYWKRRVSEIKVHASQSYWWDCSHLEEAFAERDLVRESSASWE